MISFALALASTVPSVIDAERAFAKLAQDKGQWTAFRATAAPTNAIPEALMFVPQLVGAQAWLRDKKDPTRSVRWWPTKAFLSCNGYMAVTTGGAVWPDGRHGYFTTVWTINDPDRPEWRWTLDHGGDLDAPRVETPMPEVRRASCAPVTKPISTIAFSITDPAPGGGGGGSEKDLWYSYSTSREGSREFVLWLWNGTDFDVVIHDIVPASNAK